MKRTASAILGLSAEFSPLLFLFVGNTVVFLCGSWFSCSSTGCGLRVHGRAAATDAPDQQLVAMSNSAASSADTSAPVNTIDTSVSSTAVCDVRYGAYEGEHQMDAVRALIDKDLSEPYSIYTYRYFISGWPDICMLAYDSSDAIVGAIVNKIEMTHQNTKRGYIAMLAVDKKYRVR